MPIVSQAIPALYGGVSQQAAPTRASNQCQNALNAWFTLTDGAGKRPPLQIVNNLATITHALNAPSQARTWYIAHIPYPHHDGFVLVIPGDGTYKVFQLSDGQAITMTGDTGQAYLTCSGTQKARDIFRTTTVGLKTYIVNTSVVTAMTATVADGTLTGTAQTLQDNVLDSASNGSIYKILGDETNPYDTYYAHKENGKWVEWVKPGELIQFNTATMPHVLELTVDPVDALEADADFTPGLWEEMKVGDAKSNKPISFMGKRITNIFFAHDRLGFLCENFVTMSETGRHLNLWRQTVTDVLDTDRIDISVSSDGSAFLWHAKPLGKSLILFADERNFSMDGQPIFSPRTIAITQATSYPCSRTAPPVSSGPNVYFAAHGTSATSVREMFVQDDAVTNDASDITAHVPVYIEPNIELMAANNDVDAMLLAPRGTNRLYSYNSYWAGDEKVQSAWAGWLLNQALDLQAMFSVGQSIFCVTSSDVADVLAGETTEHVNLGRFDLKPSAYGSLTCGGFTPLLDALCRAYPTYNSGENKTYFTCAFPVMAFKASARLVQLNGANEGRQWALTNPGPVEILDGADDFQFAISGDWSSDWFAVGLTYQFSYTFSEQFLSGNDRSSLTSRLQLRNMTVSFKDTVAFKTKVEVLGTPTSEELVLTSLLSTYAGRTTGNANMMLNYPQMRSGSYRFPILGRSVETVITLINDEFTPANFITAEWEALVSSRSRR